MYISAIEKGDKILVWERTADGKRELKKVPAEYYFYVSDPNGEKKTIFGNRVTRRDFSSRNELQEMLELYTDEGVETWEADIRPVYRYLSDNYYMKPEPYLHNTHYDIEVDYDPERGFSRPENPYAPINSVALFHEHRKCYDILVVPPSEYSNITSSELRNLCDKVVPLPKEYKVNFFICSDERSLLKIFLGLIEDTDILTAWNGEIFDNPYIAKRIEIQLGERYFAKLAFPGGSPPRFVEKEASYFQKQLLLQCTSRIFADYMLLYKKYELSEKPSYKLSAIADEVLVDATGDPILPKIEFKGSLATLYRDNFPLFVRYNIRDTEILHGFEEKLAYVQLANAMYHLSTGLFPGVLGTISLSELTVINYCHHELDRVVNNKKEILETEQIGGALVFYPQVGMHEWISSVDIASLYPSTIRSLNISPEMIVGQFTNTESDANEIYEKSTKPLTLKFEKTGEEKTLTAAEWNELLRSTKCSVSGYGTVFSQKKTGIIPSILSDWYKQRKIYQKKKKDALNAATEILTNAKRN